MRFDLTDLRVFLHTCDSGSMTEAASRCSLTLAAVSARVRALEEGAGVPLLRRHARGVVPTAAGETLARHARLVLQQADALRRDFAAPSSSAEPPAAVLLANSSALLRPLHRALADVLAGHAEARVLLRESGSEATVHALRSGAADAGIVSDAVDAAGLQCRELGADPLVLVAPRSHALAGRAGVRFDEVLEEAWVGWGEGSAMHLLLALHAHRAGRALRTRVTAATPFALVELVARGLGVSVVPRALLGRADAAAALAAVPLDEPWARRSLRVCHRAQSGEVVESLVRVLVAQWAGMEGELRGG
jgi:DNA-binding transcriptional LysR family regulator